jgi:ketopantoate reductase
MNGWVAEQGVAAGVLTPWNSMLAALMRAREAVPPDMMLAHRES